MRAISNSKESIIASTNREATVDSTPSVMIDRTSTHRVKECHSIIKKDHSMTKVCHPITVVCSPMTNGYGVLTND